MVMRKKLIFISVSILAAVALSSCTANYLEYNTNPENATDEQMQYENYFSQGALRTLQGCIISNEEHRFQFAELLLGGNLGGYFAEQKTFAGTFGTFDASDGWNSDAFNNVLPAIYGAYTLLSSSSAVDEVTMAVADICRIAAIARVADQYGPIPFSQVGANGSLVASYDTVEELYDTFLSVLTQSINLLTENQGAKIKSTSDICFGGDVTKWIKFANSLKLRYAMRIVYADPAKAQAAAEEAALHPVGTLSSNSDNPTYTHPTRNLHYFAAHMWGDHRASADIVSYMNGFKDPRRANYFTVSEFGGYVGWRRGVNPANAPLGNKCSNINVAADTPMRWFVAAETAFLKAEGELRGWDMGGSARDFYNEGVRLSFDQNGVADKADAYLADATSKPESYSDPSGLGLDASFDTNITPAWNDGAPFEEKLERIITQKWIANFHVEGMEAWSEFRRTGYPRLLPAAQNNSGGVIGEGEFARRAIYPSNEKNSNAENYYEAVNSDLGGKDTMASRLWWDCNPNTK
jgi:hypothetical protein